MATKIKPEFVLGVDLDGVCADFYKLIRPLVAEWLGVEEGSLPKDYDYGFKAWGLAPGEYKKLHRFAVTQRDLFRNMEPMPGAAPALRRLSDQGIRIRIITHRLVVSHFHQTAGAQTFAWLDHYGIPYWDLCFLESKGECGANLYIDDSPDNIETFLALGKDVIAFDNSTNRHIDLPSNQRAKNWQEAESLILERYETWKRENNPEAS